MTYAPTPTTTRVGSFRWVICGLLFLAATINYIDRQVIGILKTPLQAQFGWSEIDYSNIVFSFQLAYAIGFVFAGRLIDRVGTKIGFALALTLWSIAAIAHAGAPLLGSVTGFMAARFLLGLGESGNFPAAVKTVAEWFPRSERALATGLFNAGTNIGAIVTPMVVPFMTVRFGWQWAFVATGLVGFAWLALWWTLYDEPQHHPRLSAAERAYISADPPDPVVHVAWKTLLPHRQTWAVAAAKFMTDPIWWVYLFWIPDFFSRKFGLSLLELGPPVVVIYLVSDAGSIFGGWLSSTLIKRGWTVNAARKTAMLVCAAAVVPIVGASRAEQMWTAVALISIAAAAHQGWSANVYTLASDMFPRRAVGSVIGFAGMAGAVGGMLIAKVTGYVLQTTGSYLPVFVIAGTTYLATLLVVQLLAPTLEPAPLTS